MALITKIERKLRQKNIYFITLNSGERFEIYDEQIVLNSLREGKDVDVSEMQKIAHQSQEKIATDYSLQTLGRGMKSTKELKDKLKQKKFDENVIEKVLQKMQDYGYLNDVAFAREYFNYHKTHIGKKKIEFELAQKGIDSKIIHSICDEIDDQFAIAKKVAEKYLKNKILDFKTKTKLYSHLLSKGFEYQTINSVLNDYSWTEYSND